MMVRCFFFFFFSSRRRHTRLQGDWSSDVCSSDLWRLRCGTRPGSGNCSSSGRSRRWTGSRSGSGSRRMRSAECGMRNESMRNVEWGMRNREADSRSVGSPRARSTPVNSAFRIPHSEFPQIRDFAAFLAKERNDSPHTVTAYARDVADFAAFCGRYYGGRWSWAGVDRLAIRGWLGAMQERGLARRSAARALSALRTFYRFLSVTQGLDVNPAKAARTPKLEQTLPTPL